MSCLFRKLQWERYNARINIISVHHLKTLVILVLVHMCFTIATFFHEKLVFIKKPSILGMRA